MGMREVNNNRTAEPAETSNPPVPVTGWSLRTIDRRFRRGGAYLLLTGPLAVASLALAALGRSGRAVRHHHNLARRFTDQSIGRPTDRSRSGRVVLHAVLSIALWMVALVAAGVFLLIITRGLLYGFFTDGDYSTAWGGPSAAGTWLVHAAVALALVPVVVASTIGLTALHTQLGRKLLGPGDAPVWTVPVTVVCAVSAAVFLLLWSRQA